MNSNILVVLSGILSLTFATRSNDASTWRDFDGTIPDDAISAGKDKYGDVFIGQTLFEGRIIPGKLYRSDNLIYFENKGTAWSKNTNIKILCTKQLEHFQWLPTTTTEYGNIKNLNLIKGGYEEGMQTYIGITENDDGEIILGKIVCEEFRCIGFYGTDKGKSINRDYYFILMYNPQATPNYSES